ncbi:hypothetical protein E4U45_007567 [Claviceps purpurea]|nr:hypothetical protein E4U45_007567 [Claviceps purpurea]
MSGEDDINEFISKVNTLADKADIRKTARKATLFNCHLYLHTDDSKVSYERLTRVLMAAVLAIKEGYEYHRQKDLAISSSPPLTNEHVVVGFHDEELLIVELAIPGLPFAGSFKDKLGR